MSDIRNKMEELKNEFSIFDDPREKYIYLVDIAKNLLVLIQLIRMITIKFMDALHRLGYCAKKAPIKHIIFIQILMQ